MPTFTSYLSSFRTSCLLAVFCVVVANTAFGQSSKPDDSPEIPNTEAPQETPEKVDVDPVAEDVQISDRLRGIMEATEWFREPSVRVDEGVVFLSGQTTTEDHRRWAGQLAAKTQDVVAVVNRIAVDVPSLFDFSAAWTELEATGRAFIQSTPNIVAGLLMLVLTWLAVKVVVSLARRINKKRITTPLLRDIMSKAAAIPVLIIGVYVALRITGLTQLAATVLGGTGLLGIILGIAFRDIAENFLASLLISVQRPFMAGDLVTIDDQEGFVQSVTTRGTQLMTLDGNHLQIPNSIVYKSIIQNASANPNLRLSFVVGIDYADSATDAQRVILDSLNSHDAVLAEPEPLILVEDLASSTVNLRVYFWVDGQEHSALKVRSAILRRVKSVLQQRNFTLPDESREMIFPQGVPVKLMDAKLSAETQDDPPVKTDIDRSDQESGRPSGDEKANSPESESLSTVAEGGLRSDRSEIDKQAARSRTIGDGTDLLSNEPT